MHSLEGEYVPTQLLTSDKINLLTEIYSILGKIEGYLLTDFLNIHSVNSLLMVNEIRYRNTLYGEDYTYEDVILSLNSSSFKPEIKRQLELFQMCFDYAKNRVKEYGILLPTDLLRLNQCFKSGEDKYLSTKQSEVQTATISEKVSSILRFLYMKETEAPLILRLAVALSQLESVYPIDVFAQDILSTLFVNQDAISNEVFLARPIIIAKAPHNLNNSIEIMLKVISLSYNEQFQTLRRLAATKNQIACDMKIRFPKIYSDVFLKLLSENLTLRNEIIENELSVSPKTATSYLKELESNNFIASKKVGREKIYVNTRLMDAISDDLINR